ncbi:hypothetical protein [Pseudoalteromonas sp. MTN2-4]|uniref:hypothetical protein n=1 Tax=Pseudoalteromonas sp. MTN2-4 TaxID=3056555 RepID=UPI0036F1AAFC
MSNQVITSLITDPAHWDYQLSKLREFKSNMRIHIQKAKQAEQVKPQPSQNNSMFHGPNLRRQALRMAARANQRVVL